MRERRVEAALARRVKDLGGWAVKLLPSVMGLPDRIVLLPGGTVVFVELKSPTGKTAVHQDVVHERLRRLGFPVIVLSTLEAVDEWADQVVATGGR